MRPSSNTTSSRYWSSDCPGFLSGLLLRGDLIVALIILYRMGRAPASIVWHACINCKRGGLGGEYLDGCWLAGFIAKFFNGLRLATNE